MNKQKRIAFLISDELSILSLKPLIKYFQYEDYSISFVVSKYLKDETLLIKKKNDEVIYLEDLKCNRTLQRLIFYFLIIILTPFNFSETYQFTLKNFLGKFKFLRFLGYLIPNFLKNQTKTNRIIVSCMSRLFSENPLAKRLLNTKLYTTTLFDMNYLLSHSSLEIYTYVESWDNLYKLPIGYVPRKVFLWNEPLCKEWQHYQGKSSTIPTMSFKHDYANIKPYKSNNNNVYIYAMTSSSKSNNILYNEETLLVHKLCKYFSSKNNIKLLIKPKPSTPKHELDHYLKYKNIKIGNYNSNVSHKFYGLSEEYNNSRLSEMRHACAVITFATTYLFDAALYGLPVYQLKINDTQFFRLNNVGPHIRRNLFTNEKYFLNINDFSQLDSILDKMISDPILKANAIDFSKYIKSWFRDDLTVDEHIKNIAREIINA